MILQDSFNPSMPPSTLGAAGTEEAEACNASMRGQRYESDCNDVRSAGAVLSSRCDQLWRTRIMPCTRRIGNVPDAGLGFGAGEVGWSASSGSGSRRRIGRE